MARYAIPDIHGNYKALVDILKQINFDYDNDELITLGDYVDGWSESFEVIEELMKIKNIVPLIGNHDEWFINLSEKAIKMVDDNTISFNYFTEVGQYSTWQMNGGNATIKSYYKNKDHLERHITWLKENGKYYYIDDENNLFIHAGYPNALIPEKGRNVYQHEYLWDRHYVYNKVIRTLNNKEYKGDKNFNKVFIGHTPTLNFDDENGNKIYDIIINKNIYLMDCGVGFYGKLSCINLDTNEIYYSDFGNRYYPDDPGRVGISYNEIKNK